MFDLIGCVYLYSYILFVIACFNGSLSNSCLCLCLCNDHMTFGYIRIEIVIDILDVEQRQEGMGKT